MKGEVVLQIRRPLPFDQTFTAADVLPGFPAPQVDVLRPAYAVTDPLATEPSLLEAKVPEQQLYMDYSKIVAQYMRLYHESGGEASGILF